MRYFLRLLLAFSFVGISALVALAAPPAEVQQAVLQSTSNGTSVFVALPAAPTVGNVIWTALGAYSSGPVAQAITPPAGWTACSAANNASGATMSSYWAWKIAASPADTTSMFTTTTSGVVATNTSVTVASGAIFTVGHPIIFEPGTANEEILNVSAIATNTLTIAAATKTHTSGVNASPGYNFTIGTFGTMRGGLMEWSGLSATPCGAGGFSQPSAVTDGANFDYAGPTVASANAGEIPIAAVADTNSFVFSCPASLNPNWLGVAQGTITGVAGWNYPHGAGAHDLCFGPLAIVTGQNRAINWRSPTGARPVIVSMVWMTPATILSDSNGSAGNGQDVETFASQSIGNGLYPNGSIGGGSDSFPYGPPPPALPPVSGNGKTYGSTTQSLGNGGQDHDPNPTATPSPVPTATPTPAAAATFNGCQVGVAGDIWNHVVTSDAVDPNSAAEITNSAAVHNNPFFSSVKLEAINIATNATATIATHSTSGHTGPTTVPYLSTYYFEASPPIHNGGGGDSHFMVLNTDTCQYWEAYAASIVSGKLNFYAINSQASALTNTGRYLGMSQVAPGNSYTTAGGLDLFPSLIKYEEIVAGVIRHALIMNLQVGTVSNSTYVYPGGPQISGAYSGAQPVLHYADHLRLKAAYTDGSATTACSTVLTALKTYGAYINDLAGFANAIYFADGVSDPLGTGYNSYNFNCLGNLRLSNFDVLTPVTRP